MMVAQVGDPACGGEPGGEHAGRVAAMPDRAEKCPVVPSERNGQRPVDAAAMSRRSTNAPCSREASNPTPAACVIGPGPRAVLYFIPDRH
jgi:hypothetical protein